MAIYKLSSNKKNKKTRNVKKIVGFSFLATASFVFLFLTGVVKPLQTFLLGLLGVFGFPLCIVLFVVGLALLNNRKYVMSIKYTVCLVLCVFFALCILQLAIVGGKGGLGFGDYLAKNYIDKWTAGGICIGFFTTALLYSVNIYGAYVVFALGFVLSLALLLDSLHFLKKQRTADEPVAVQIKSAKKTRGEVASAAAGANAKVVAKENTTLAVNNSLSGNTSTSMGETTAEKMGQKMGGNFQNLQQMQATSSAQGAQGAWTAQNLEAQSAGVVHGYSKNGQIFSNTTAGSAANLANATNSANSANLMGNTNGSANLFAQKENIVLNGNLREQERLDAEKRAQKPVFAEKRTARQILGLDKKHDVAYEYENQTAGASGSYGGGYGNASNYGTKTDFGNKNASETSANKPQSLKEFLLTPPQVDLDEYFKDLRAKETPAKEEVDKNLSQLKSQSSANGGASGENAESANNMGENADFQTPDVQVQQVFGDDEFKMENTFVPRSLSETKSKDLVDAADDILRNAIAEEKSENPQYYQHLGEEISENANDDVFGERGTRKENFRAENFENSDFSDNALDDENDSNDVNSANSVNSVNNALNEQTNAAGARNFGSLQDSASFDGQTEHLSEEEKEQRVIDGLLSRNNGGGFGEMGEISRLDDRFSDANNAFESRALDGKDRLGDRFGDRLSNRADNRFEDRLGQQNAERTGAAGFNYDRNERNDRSREAFNQSIRQREEKMMTQEDRDARNSFNENYDRMNARNGGLARQQQPIAPEEPEEIVPYVYEKPPLDLIKTQSVDLSTLNEEVEKKRLLLENALENFGVPAKVQSVVVGPAVTRYELEMPQGISVQKIKNRADDIALSLAAEGSIRIEAPIPGKSMVGIEVPNASIATVSLKDVLASREFTSASSPLTFALGKDLTGRTICADMKKLTHLLVAGSTGSGKSVCLNSIILSIIYKASPEDVKIILIDPKRVEFVSYQGLPHLIMPDIVSDTQKAINTLTWAVNEMERRFDVLGQARVREINEYNALPDVVAGKLRKMPYMVIIVDELADLMMTGKKEVEEKVCRLAQKARAAGIHLILATQRPSTDVITGLIKANFPSRISFAVKSYVDSMVMLDRIGAEKLLGKGDMLYFPNGAMEPVRVQGCFVTTSEINNIVDFCRDNNEAIFDPEIEKQILNPNKNGANGAPGINNDMDELLPHALKISIECGQASATMIRRKFAVGYPRAAKIIDQMEAAGYISSADGAKGRSVYITEDEFHDLFGDAYD